MGLTKPIEQSKLYILNKLKYLKDIIRGGGRYDEIANNRKTNKIHAKYKFSPKKHVQDRAATGCSVFGMVLYVKIRVIVNNYKILISFCKKSAK